MTPRSAATPASGMRSIPCPPWCSAKSRRCNRPRSLLSIGGFRWSVKDESDSAWRHEQDIPPLEDRRAAVSTTDVAGLRWSGPSRPVSAELGEGGYRPFQDYGHLRQRAEPAAV